MPGDSSSRRDFLSLLGTSGLIGVAGCNEAPSSSTTKASRDSPQPATASPTDSPTDTAIRTKTRTETRTETPEEEWTVEPLEHEKLIGSHYYIWYDRNDGWLGRTPGMPLLGEYGSAESDVINQHIKWAVEHGINWFSISWWGQFDVNTPVLETDFLNATLSQEIDFSILYESKGRLEMNENGKINLDNPNNQRQLLDDFRYIDRSYFERENYLTISGRPVVFIYLAHAFTGDIASIFRQLREELTHDVFFIADIATFIPSQFGPGQLQEFDATTLYNPLSVVDSSAINNLDSFLNQVLHRYLTWRLFGRDNGIGFLPTMMPGYDDRQLENRDNHTYLKRSTERLQKLSTRSMAVMDSSLDALLITSFNEWPEFTAIEPGKKYGTKYLDLVAEELVPMSPNYNADNYYRVVLDFNQTVDELDVNPDASGNRQLAIMAAEIELFDSDKESIQQYNIGSRGAEPVLTEGAYFRERNNSRSWRWFGGPGRETIMYFQPSAFQDAAEVRLRASSVNYDISITADVLVEGVKVDDLRFNRAEWRDYFVQI